MKRFFSSISDNLAAVLLFGIPVCGVLIIICYFIGSLFIPSAPSDREIRDYAEMYREEWYNEGYSEGKTDGEEVGYEAGYEDGRVEGYAEGVSDCQVDDVKNYLAEADLAMNSVLEIIENDLSDPDIPVEDYYDDLSDSVYDALAWLKKARDANG